MIAETQNLPDEIVEARAKLARWDERLLEMVETVRVFELTMEKFDCVVRVSIAIFSDGPKANLETRMSSMSEVTELLRFLSTHGIHQEGGAFDSPDTHTRIYRVTGPGWVSIQFHAGSSCRFVKTSVEMKPVYEIKCDGGDA